MKKYENPEITITMFDSESVLCDSATASQLAKKALGEATTIETSLSDWTVAF